MSELKIENVSYRYKNASRLTLEGVSCVFQVGKVTAVVGPSGSGKTTLLSLMAGLDRPEGGQVLLGDEDLSGMDLDAYRRGSVSVIFQAFQLFPLLTVLENVCYPMELGGVPVKKARERARGLLESVGIGSEKLRRFPANLSGGEQQRVAIARAIVNEPAILLADEPTGNLDPTNSWEIMKLLEEANDRGTTVLVVTHNQEIVNEMKKRVITMKKGVIVSDEKKGGYKNEN